MEQFRLEVRDYAGPLRWRWLLTKEGTGRALADHQVNRDKDAENSARSLFRLTGMAHELANSLAALEPDRQVIDAALAEMLD